MVPLIGSKAANVHQVITLPSAAQVITWTYWFQFLGTAPGDDDCFVVGALEGSTELTSKQRCAAQGYQTGWTQDTIDLSPYRGKSVIILFGMTTQFSQNHKNYALVDDVSVKAQ